jgi:hypothetical protein
MRWLKFILLLAACGCGKSSDPKAPPKVTFDATKPARAELQVLEQAGLWEMDTSLVTHNAETQLAQTNHSTATMQVSWAVNGIFLLLETEINSQPKGYELVVKNLDTNDKANPYRCTWFHDDGLVRGYAGQWQPKQARMDWVPLYLPSAPKGMDIQMTDISTGPGKRQFSYQILEDQKLIVSGLFKARHAGKAVPPAAAATPTSEQLKRLGQAGMWKETQTLVEGGAIKELESVSRMRWSRGGKFLINEGVTDPAGTKDYFLWVKTWDTQDGVYRWAYFWQDGHVDHFTGYWDAAKNLITWQCVYPQVVIELREILVSPKERTWTVEAHTTEGITSTGSGSSHYQGKAK